MRNLGVHRGPACSMLVVDLRQYFGYEEPLDLSHGGTSGTGGTSPGTELRATSLAPLDEREDHGDCVPSPGKPEECHGCLGLPATLLAAVSAVGDFVVQGVSLMTDQHFMIVFLFLGRDVRRWSSRGTPIWQPRQYQR